MNSLSQPLHPSLTDKPAAPPLLCARRILDIEEKAAHHAAGTADLTVRTVHEALRAAAFTEEEIIERMCARIKAADDAAADGGYMLDSGDCISVLRGTWRGPLANDCPPKPLDQVQGKPETFEAFVDEYLEGYEMVGESADGRDACHVPTEDEKALIKDAIMGLPDFPRIPLQSTTLPFDDVGTESPALWTHFAPARNPSRWLQGAQWQVHARITMPVSGTGLTLELQHTAFSLPNGSYMLFVDATTDALKRVLCDPEFQTLLPVATITVLDGQIPGGIRALSVVDRLPVGTYDMFLRVCSGARPSA